MSVDQLGMPQAPPEASSATQQFSANLQLPRAQLHAAAPWQAGDADRPAKGSVVPLPGFKAAFNPFGSALPNVPTRSKAREAPPHKWMGGLPAVKPHRKPEAMQNQQNQRLRKGRRLREKAARERASVEAEEELPQTSANTGHFVDPIGAVRQRDGTLGDREHWRPTLDGVGARHGGIYRQPACVPRREDTSWRVFGSCAQAQPPPLTAVERVRALREARQLARVNAESLAQAQQTASAALFRPEQDPHGRGNQRAMGGNFDGTAEGIIAAPARLPPVVAGGATVKWGADTKPLRRDDVPHSRLTVTQSEKVSGPMATIPDKDRREPHSEQYREDSLRTLVSPTYHEPAEQPTASYHHRVEKGSRAATRAQPHKQQPWPAGNQGNRAKLATMDPLVSQFAQWDDPVVG